MKKSSKTAIVIAVCALVLTGFAALVVHNYKTKTSLKYDQMSAEELKPEQNSQDAVNAAVNNEAASEAQKSSTLLKLLPSDIALGNKNAPVILIEYASLSCPHCSAFVRESFEKLKVEYIDSGKVLMVYRDFPLNQSALTGAMLAFCKADDHKEERSEKYYATIKALMKTQDSWAFDAKYEEKLEGIAKLDGMSSERFKSCVNDKNLQERILAARMDAAKSLQIKSTPSFFINGEVSEGYVDYQTIKRLIDKKLSEVK